MHKILITQNMLNVGGTQEIRSPKRRRIFVFTACSANVYTHTNYAGIQFLCRTKHHSEQVVYHRAAEINKSQPNFLLFCRFVESYGLVAGVFCPWFFARLLFLQAKSIF
jgi:hypothetical protein